MFVPTLKYTDVVKVNPDIKKIFNRALKITMRNQKEIGVYACGKSDKNVVNFNNGAIRTSTNLDKNSFWFNTEAFPSIERSSCRGDDKLVALVHTHPNGNNIPSFQDRSSSKQTDMMGCVFGSSGLRCFYGDKDFETRL